MIKRSMQLIAIMSMVLAFSCVIPLAQISPVSPAVTQDTAEVIEPPKENLTLAVTDLQDTAEVAALKEKVAAAEAATQQALADKAAAEATTQQALAENAAGKEEKASAEAAAQKALAEKASAEVAAQKALAEKPAPSGETPGFGIWPSLAIMLMTGFVMLTKRYGAR